MKTEITQPMNTETNKPINAEPMNTQENEVDAITANTDATTTATVPSESANGPLKDNTERLAELATKIRDAYAKEHEAEGMVVDWKAKQLKAGIEMGEYLIEAKSLLPFKGFVKWCRENFPNLTQRTLNRYMKLARNKDEKHVSQAKGLRDAYEKCSASDRQGESDGESDLRKDFETIKRHLSKAKDVLNDYPNLAPCEEAETVCDLVDALTDWVMEYRARDDGHSLDRHRDSDVEIPLGDENQPNVAEEETEFSTAE